MKIILTNDTMADGKPVSKGQIVEVSDSEGKFLVSEKKAKKISKESGTEAEIEEGTESEELSKSDAEPTKEAEA